MKDINNEKKTALDWFADKKKLVAEIGDTIWRYAEPGLREYKSAKYLADYLKRNDFKIDMDIADLGPVAFQATYGSGKPVIGTYLEYDSSPGASQRSDVPYRKPIIPRGPGFTDAHNMLGTAAAVGFVGTKVAMEEHGLKGTLKVFGTPFEKQNCGKVWLASYGYLDDLDAVVGWHPSDITSCAWDSHAYPYMAIAFEFTTEPTGSWDGGGQTLWTGKSALDAAHAMHFLVKSQKEHNLAPLNSIDELVFAGGACMVLLQSIATSAYCCRAGTIEWTEKAETMLRNCAKAAAQATGCKVNERIISRLRQFNPNHTMAELCHRNQKIVGPPKFSEEDKVFIREIQKNLGMEPMKEPFDETITPPWEYEKAVQTFKGAGLPAWSDDSNEFSWYAPTIRMFVAFEIKPYPQWEADPTAHWYPWWVESTFCARDAAHEMGYVAAKDIALSNIELLTTPSVLKKAKEEFESRPKVPCRIPKGVKPPVDLPWPTWIDDRYPTEMNLEKRTWRIPY